MKRKLNGEEMKISAKSMVRLNEELEYNQYQLSICDLKLNGGLNVEHKKQVRDYKKLRLDYEGEVKMLKERINILQSQIRNGVEMKEKVNKAKEEK